MSALATELLGKIAYWCGIGGCGLLSASQKKSSNWGLELCPLSGAQRSAASQRFVIIMVVSIVTVRFWEVVRFWEGLLIEVPLYSTWHFVSELLHKRVPLEN
jgi:hypothetical protein